MYWKSNIIGGRGYCDHCGNYSSNTSYNARKWWHVYFIPFIPEGPRMRVVKECQSCSNGMHICEAEVPSVLDDLRQNATIPLDALIAGQDTFIDEGTMTPCVPALAGLVELFHCFCADDYVEFVLATLREKGLTYAYHLINGSLLEFQGRDEEAATSFRKASESNPTEVLPLMSLGSIHLNINDLDGARLIYEKALELSTDKLPVFNMLLTVYESLKDHARLSETYEDCFKLEPELATDKRFFKSYKKACKKAGKQPKTVMNMQ